MNIPSQPAPVLVRVKRQDYLNGKHLNAIALCYYILGGLTFLFSCSFIVDVNAGKKMLHDPARYAQIAESYSRRVTVPTAHRSMFVKEVAYGEIIITLCGVLYGCTLGGLMIYAGWCLKRRIGYVFVNVIAGINCAVVVPLGTILGVFTFVILARPSVKALFPR